MRIFTAIRHSLEPQFFYGDLWSRNFYPALRQLGHELIESQIDLYPTSRFMHIPNHFTPAENEKRAETTQKIIDEVKAAHAQKPVHLFLSYFYNSHFEPSGFDQIHALGISTINFYCNSIYQFELVEDIARKAQYSWFPERDALNRYRAIGARPIRVQMGADPELYKPIPSNARKARACFIGQNYADRSRWLKSLAKEGVGVDIYGSGWNTNASQNNSKARGVEYLGRRVNNPGSFGAYAEQLTRTLKQYRFQSLGRIYKQIMYKVNADSEIKWLKSLYRGRAQSIPETFSQYEVVLNFSNVWADGRPGSKLIPHVRLRDFEGPMCGTCYLTGETDEIHEFFTVSKEIDTYSDPEELIQKTRYYLTNAQAAEKLRVNAYQRSIQTHTWKHRFLELFSKTNLETR